MTTEVEQNIEQSDKPVTQHSHLQKKERLNSPSMSSIQTSSQSGSGWNANKIDPAGEQRTHSGLSSGLGDSNVKFPLENCWSFWFFKNDKSKKWEDNVKFITSVDFVEDFWGVYNHMQLVSNLSMGCDYMVFKKDIPPMWEDDANRDGGRWILTIDKKYRQTSLDAYWLNTILALIGDQFIDDSPFVNGVVVNVRPRGDKVSLWTRTAKDAELQMRIGRKFKEILNLKDGSIVYEEHDESNKKGDQGLYRC